MTDQEEKDERARLEKEVPDGMYTIGEGKWIAHTGKGGYIDFHIAMMKAAEEFKLEEHE